VVQEQQNSAFHATPMSGGASPLACRLFPSRGTYGPDGLATGLRRPLVSCDCGGCFGARCIQNAQAGFLRATEAS
jgi:hypothetical protein